MDNLISQVRIPGLKSGAKFAPKGTKEISYHTPNNVTAKHEP